MKIPKTFPNALWLGLDICRVATEQERRVKNNKCLSYRDMTNPSLMTQSRMHKVVCGMAGGQSRTIQTFKCQKHHKSKCSPGQTKTGLLPMATLFSTILSIMRIYQQQENCFHTWQTVKKNKDNLRPLLLAVSGVGGASK